MENDNNRSVILSTCISNPLKVVIPLKFENTELYDYWTGYVFLNENPPDNSGINFYINNKYNIDNINEIYKIDEPYQSNIIDDIKSHNNDVSKWTKTTIIGNIFNRLVIFNNDLFHSSSLNFGLNVEDSRLVQYFSFRTLKNKI